ncbi:lipocalin family protein [Sphaerochaeta sp.]|uniref:lipocalin family protein n=1 Tax=Sphaerochaeta sp. TaxID=1972642 RepID=UPI002FC6B8E9
MRKTQIVLMTGLLAGLLALSGCATKADSLPPLKTVDSLDLNRYLGSWYEIARYQHQFEKTLVGAKADYSLRDDGRIQVVNSGLKTTLDGKFISVKAVAWRPDEAVPGALKVKFFNLFTSDYLVFGLDEENYQWALVGNNNRKYLWFLSRTPTVSDELLAKMKAIAVQQGYDLEKLFMVPQKER